MRTEATNTAQLALSHSFEFMAALFFRVGAENELRMVDRLRGSLASGAKINPSGLSIFGDTILCAENGHKVAESQQVWVNASLRAVRSLANAAAEFLWVYERLSVKEEFVVANLWPAEIRITSCGRCGSIWVSRRDVESIAAVLWAPLKIRPLIESGDIEGAVEETLNCNSCFAFIEAIENILEERNIKRVENANASCPFCSGEIRYSLSEISWDTASSAAKRRVV